MWRRHSCLRVAEGDSQLRFPLVSTRAAFCAARRQECLRHNRRLIAFRLSPHASRRGQVDEKLHVSFRAANGRLHEPFDCESDLLRERDYPLDRGAARVVVANDSTLANVAFAHLELRLDQRNDAPARRDELEDGR